MSRSALTLSKEGITLRDKAIFTGVIIVLVVAVAILINQHYYGTLRNSMTTPDFLLFASPVTEIDQSLYQNCIEFQRQLGSMVNESIIQVNCNNIIPDS